MMKNFTPIFAAVLLLIGASSLLPAAPLHAQTAGSCHPVARSNQSFMRVAGPTDLNLIQAQNTVSIRYLSHASFRLISPEGVHIATDFTGFNGTVGLPDVATMNTIHDGHFTFEPDERISQVLQGWATDGVPAEHHLRLGDTIIRNVPTDFTTEATGFRPAENSIFVFEIAGLCIGHLGHLHQYPTDDEIAQIGRLDVMMAQIGGISPLSIDQIDSLSKRLGARIVIPMHWGFDPELHSYLGQARRFFKIEGHNDNAVDVSILTLPTEPTMLVLTPETSFGLFRDQH